jgi:hypothetical protein
VAQFFRNPKDLGSWIRSKGTISRAFNDLMRVIKISSKDDEQFVFDEQDVKNSVSLIYNDDDENAAKSLYKILSQYGLTNLKLKQGTDMEKKAQSRQRNDWLNGDRNKWNRAVDGHTDRTPWRINRNQMYDFTHYQTDAISFDEDPSRVYSGEALWRMYVMDKFYREHKTEDGKWVGGYINDRFHVFPDAGTPANPDVPRDGGNQMGLGLNERTRKPRPHQFSTERMMEEARGNETYDLEVTTNVASGFNKLVKTSGMVPVSRHEDRVYNMFTDCIEMKEAGISYEDMLEKVSDHYDASITGVAEIAKYADKMVKKHEKIAYAFDLTAKTVTAQGRETYRTVSDMAAQTLDPASNTQVPVNLLEGTVLVKMSPTLYEISSGQGMGQQVMIETDISQMVESLDSMDDNIQDAADELGLNEVGEAEKAPQPEETEALDTFQIDEV